MFITLCIFVVVAVHKTTAQVSAGTPCETPNEDYGTCISIYECSDLLDLLVKDGSNAKTRTYLRSFTCGYEGNTPLVCCPNNRQKSLIDGSSTEKIVATYTLPSKPDCGFSNATNPRVVNGIPAKLGEFPWMVALGYKNTKNPALPKWLCGGTLITRRHILTAAHCAYNRDDLYTARVGDLDLYSDTDGATPETIPLQKIKIHEGFSPVNFTNDIAILTLSQEPTTSTVWPICLPVAEPLRSRSLIKLRPTVAGWGTLYYNGPSSPTLQEVVIPVVDNEQCNKVYSSQSVVDNRVICAGFSEGGKDACRGDSGGPLMLPTNEFKNIRYYQIGVVSYGLRCAEAGYPGVYTKVTAFLEWIEKNLN